MEDYNSNLLNDSKNEWSIRLMNILCGHVIDGFRSIFNESMEVCESNDEPEKYLMTFQNFLSRIPKWNQNMIEQECARIKDTTKCCYLEDLITCVHVIQLKILSCVRTSNQAKKIDIDIPEFNSFLHNVYINIARKLYSNIYLFQVDVTPLEQQKNTREFEHIVQACIMNTIRDNIPIDQLLKQYMDETQEDDVLKEEKIISAKPVEDNESTPKPSVVPTVLPSSTDTSVNVNNETNDVVPVNNNISFDQDVEKYDPVNEEKTSQPINFESKEEPKTLYDDDEDTEIISIGDSINMNLGEELLNPPNVSYEKESNIVLDVEDLDNEVKKEEVIDLGVEQLTL